MGIDLEKQEAEKYRLDLIGETNLLKINLKNVSIIEAILKIDSRYKKSFSIDSKPEEKSKYKGSTAYWANELKTVLENKKAKSGKSYEGIVKELVFAIDREFSTHLNSDKVGREQIPERIIELKKEEIIENLKDPKKAGYSLFNKISEPTKIKGKERKRNKSFASKFCHFVCFYYFEDEIKRDKYSIYDRTVKGVLQKYANHYIDGYKGRSRKYNLDEYSDYCACIDEIIECAQKKENEEEKISRNGFDHLLWYYHKGE